MIYDGNYHSDYYKNTFGDGNLHFGEEMSPFLVSLRSRVDNSEHANDI